MRRRFTLTQLRSPKANYAGQVNVAKNNKLPAFTLIELIIVVAILAILAATIFVAIDPALRLAAARNNQRRTAVSGVATALGIKQAEGNALALIDEKWRMIGTAATGCNVRCDNLRGGSTRYALDIDGKDGTNATYASNQGYFSFDIDSPFSISLWAKPRTAESKLFQQGTIVLTVGQGIALLSNATSLNFFLFPYNPSSPTPYTPLFINQAQPLPIDVFSHLVVTYNGNRNDPEVVLYRDGVPVGSHRPGTAVNGDLASDARMLVGAVDIALVIPIFIPVVINVEGSHDGIIDDFRVYNSLLTPQDVSLLSVGEEASMQPYVFWSFDADMPNMPETFPQALSDIPSSPAAPLTIQKAAADRGIIWTDDVPEQLMRLPSACRNAATDLSGTLPKTPVSPKAGNILPDLARTYYAVRKAGSSFLSRSCLSEIETNGGVAPLIESSR